MPLHWLTPREHQRPDIVALGAGLSREAEPKNREVTVEVLKRRLLEAENVAPDRIVVATGEKRHAPADRSRPLRRCARAARHRETSAMIRSLLIGLTAGARSLTPLAIVADAARRGALPRDSGAPAWLGGPAVAAGAAALAGGELLGDKLRSAPDRIVPVGILARLLTAGLAGAALASRRNALLGAALGAGAAVAAAHVTFAARARAMRRFGQTPTGLVEDGLTLALARWIVSGAEHVEQV